MHFFFLFFPSQGEELLWPTDGSCSPLRVGKHLGSSERADQEEDDAWIYIFYSARLSDLQSLENEKEKIRGTSPECSEGLQ